MVMKKYIDLLIQQLRLHGNDGKTPVDLRAWFNFTTFDTMGDLIFAEPFGCLEKAEYHPWIPHFLNFGRISIHQQWLSHFPMFSIPIGALIMASLPKDVLKTRAEDREFTLKALERRLQIAKGRPDIVQGFIDSGMDGEALEANAAAMIMAGSETAGTLLAGAAHLLLSHPDTLRRLTEEVRSAFKEEADIDFNSVKALSYLQACIDESLRRYPPVPAGMGRIVPKEGATIAGHFVPGDVSQFSSCPSRAKGVIEYRRGPSLGRIS